MYLNTTMGNGGIGSYISIALACQSNDPRLVQIYFQFTIVRLGQIYHIFLGVYDIKVNAKKVWFF